MPSTPDLTDSQAAALVAIDDAWNRETFLGRVGVGIRAADSQLEHPNWPPDTPPPSKEDVRQLRHLGLLEFDREAAPDWVFWPSEDGQTVARQLRGQAAAEYEPFPGTHEWRDMLRVINAVMDVYGREGTVGVGVRAGSVADALGCSPHDPNLHSALLFLAEGDYLHFQGVGDLAASWVRPAPRGLEYARGWPGGGGDDDATLARLLAAVDAAAAEAPPETRGRAKAVREFFLELGAKASAEVVTKTAGIG